MKKLIFFAILFLISSCVVSKQDSDQPSNVSAEDAVEPDMADELLLEEGTVYRAARTRFVDLLHTRLEVSFDWSKSQLEGKASLRLKPHFYDLDSIVLDAKGMDIHNISIGATNLNFLYDSLQLFIQLPKSYKKEESIELNIIYTAKPDQRRIGGSDAINSDKGLFFINPKGEEKNKMPQIWTQGETESNSVWFPTIDSPNSKSTQEIFITVDRKFTTLSNGKLISSKENPNGTRTDYWKQDLPHAPYLFMMAVGEFKTIKDVFVRKDGSKMEVNYLVEPEWESSAKAIFGETPAMISYFSNLLGVEYPWDKYSQIVVRDYVSGAMENTGAVVFGDYVYKNERELLDNNDQSTIAHELFHHWFGDLVTCESWSNLPLNESFANYSQYLWDEHRYGLDEADYQAEQEAEGYFQVSDISIYGHHNMIWFDYRDKEEMFDVHSYNKGGRILHMLRNHIGDEAFFKGLNYYLTQHKYKSAEIHDLRLAFEEVTGMDLNWFFNQWFFEAGYPVLDVKQTVDTLKKQVTLSVEQIQNLDLSPLYTLPLSIAVWDENGRKSIPIRIEKEKSTFTFPYNGTLKNIVFDEQCMLLAKIREEKPVEQYIHQFKFEKRYESRKNAIIQLPRMTKMEAENLIGDALNDPFWSIRLLAIDKAQSLKISDAGFLVKIIELAAKDPVSKVRNRAVSYLVDHQSNAEMLSFCTEQLKSERSYLVIQTLLSALSDLDKSTALQAAKMFQNEPSSSLQDGIAQVFANVGTESEYPFFVKALSSNLLNGYDKLSFINAFTIYLNQRAPSKLSEAFPIFQELKSGGDFYVSMYFDQMISYSIDQMNSRNEQLQLELNRVTKEGEIVKVNEVTVQLTELKELIEKYESLLAP